MGIEITYQPDVAPPGGPGTVNQQLERFLDRVGEQWEAARERLEADGWECFLRGRVAKFDHPDVKTAAQAEARILALGLDPARCTIAEFCYAARDPNLARAFRLMRASGLLAKQDFGWCPSQGVAAIREKAARLSRKGRAPDGFVFYNEQMADAVNEGSDLYLAFGPFEPNGGAAAAVATTACRCLRAEGLECVWDGDVSRTILVRARSIEFPRC